MKRKILNTLKYLFFLCLGVFIFWLIYRKYDVNDIIVAVKEVNYFWIVMSLLFSILSQISRTMRWRLLIDSIGYKTRFTNVFLSCYILYLVNLFVPRAGEVARCSVVSGTDKVPFAKLVGTMIVERLADVIMLFFLAVIIFLTNLQTIDTISNKIPALKRTIDLLFTLQNLVIVVVVGIVGVIALLYFRKKRKEKNKDVREHKESLWTKLLEGIDSIFRLEKKWAFIGHTVFIFAMWLAMLYVVFLAFVPTEHLSIRAGMLTFLMGGIAMLVPVQGGIGPWHALVSGTLVYGYEIAEKQADMFAFIAHTTTNLVYILFGGIALVLIFVLNSGKIQLSRKQDQKDGVVSD